MKHVTEKSNFFIWNKKIGRSLIGLIRFDNNTNILIRKMEYTCICILFYKSLRIFFHSSPIWMSFGTMHFEQTRASIARCDISKHEILFASMSFLLSVTSTSLCPFIFAAFCFKSEENLHFYDADRKKSIVRRKIPSRWAFVYILFEI